jgi:hypothetical protein
MFKPFATSSAKARNAKYSTATAHSLLFTSHRDKNNVDYDRNAAVGVAIYGNGRG